MNTAAQPENRHSQSYVSPRQAPNVAIKANRQAFQYSEYNSMQVLIAQVSMYSKGLNEYGFGSYTMGLLLCYYIHGKAATIVQVDKMIKGKRRNAFGAAYKTLGKLMKLGFIKKSYYKTIKNFGQTGYKYSLTLAGRAYCEELIKHYERELKKLSNNKFIG